MNTGLDIFWRVVTGIITQVLALCINPGEQKCGERCSSKRKSNLYFQTGDVECVCAERDAKASDTWENLPFSGC